MSCSVETSPFPWTMATDNTPSGQSVKIIDANGGVVALMKAAGGRKLANARAIVAMSESIDGKRNSTWFKGSRECADCHQLEEPVCTMNCSSAERSTGPHPDRIRCGCSPQVVDRVREQNKTCGMGGCPYGGDF